jgi:hypothetical protein
MISWRTRSEGRKELGASGEDGRLVSERRGEMAGGEVRHGGAGLARRGRGTAAVARRGRREGGSAGRSEVGEATSQRAAVD